MIPVQPNGLLIEIKRLLNTIRDYDEHQTNSGLFD
jgi:hypothetical protein